MPVKRRTSKARAQLTDLAYKYLTDAPLSDEEKADFDYFVLEYNQYDSAIGADTATLWKRHGPEILKEWIKTKPDTRPFCWWRFQSGIKRQLGPMKLTENLTAKNVLYTWRHSVPEDQGAWLAEHGI